jgi:hypothetical protein
VIDDDQAQFGLAHSALAFMIDQTLVGDGG